MSYISKDNAVRILQQLPPFFLQSATAFEKVATKRSQLFGDVRADGILSFEFDGDSYRFAVQITETSSNAALQVACQQALLTSKSFGLPTLVVVPYLRDDQIKMFRESGSGINVIDLCGNAMISIPGLHVWQRGAPNKFPDSRRIKNPYRGNSALVGRALLIDPVFPSTGALHTFITRTGCTLGLSAVSKAISELEEELIVKREGSSIKLWDPLILLGRLAENYRIPNYSEKIELKIRINEELIPDQVATVGQKMKVKTCPSGRTSFAHYAGGATNACMEYYVDSPLDSFVQQLKMYTEAPIVNDSIFPNIKLINCSDQVVYFDRRGWLAASPVQTYLELWHGDPRETEIAKRVKETILEELS